MKTIKRTSRATNAANLKARAGEGTESRLCARAGGLGAVSASGAELDVDGVDADLPNRETRLSASSDLFSENKNAPPCSGQRRPGRQAWQRRATTRRGQP